jgi:hypothetical protein
MVTDEEGAAPGGGADRVSAVAFFEVERGGLAVVGDAVTVAGNIMGHIAGYDMTHMPNHMNVLVKRENLETPPINVGDTLEIKRA